MPTLLLRRLIVFSVELVLLSAPGSAFRRRPIGAYLISRCIDGCAPGVHLFVLHDIDRVRDSKLTDSIR